MYTFFSEHLQDYVDEADKLLSAEFAHLLSLKRALESQLRKVQQQLQVLSSCRGRLAALIQERSRVTELICHSMTSAPHRIDAPAIAQRSRKLGHTKSHSAPVPLLMTGQTFSPGTNHVCVCVCVCVCERESSLHSHILWFSCTCT